MNPTAHVDIWFPPTFMKFARLCEVYCVAGCCGLDAFSFDTKTLSAAVKQYGVPSSQLACDEADAFANVMKVETAECRSSQDDFNHGWASGAELSGWIQNIVAKVRPLFS